jgi:rRNA maturation RNase YbeY
MRQLNARYKRQDRVTDVLSFALTIPDGRLAGDIYICRAEAVRQARLHGRPGREELLRLVVHGVLHVLGYDHPDTDARERSAMWRRQERYVRKLLKK